MGGRGSGRKPLIGFSNRELELIALVLKGMQNKAIADQLLLSPATVRNQLNGIFKKSGCKNKFELVVWWFGNNDNLGAARK
jgi:DNA-binding CsgD family transcriptional regulator